MATVHELRINGARRKVAAEPGRSLLSVLRDDLELTGAKYGCGEGQCGACTVMLDGRAVRSCITPLSAAAGKEIVTVEGIARNGRLHPVQQAFLEDDALQCGYCTPGMVVSAVALLNRNPNPSEADIVRAMEGNVCRCGVYPRLIAAIQRAARTMRSGRS